MAVDQVIAGVGPAILIIMQFDLRQFPDPSPPPIKEPPDPEDPDIPMQEPDPTELFQI
jgi:hypothetical protein